MKKDKFMKQKFALIIFSFMLLVSCEPKIKLSDMAILSTDAEVYSDQKLALIEEVEKTLQPFDGKSNEMQKSIVERMQHYKIPALSIAVINNYEVDWARAYGWADKEAKIKATPETLFQAASVSKSINALGILNWAELNKIDLNSDIDDYLTNWKIPNRKKAIGKKISLAQVLSHTAGLSVNGFDGYKAGANLPTTLQILNGQRPANSNKVKSISEPGKEFNYCGGGILITQFLLSENTGIAYDKYMKEAILNPLGMNKSSFSQTLQNESLARAYKKNGAPLKGGYRLHPEMAAAGLWSNPLELCQYVIEIQKSLIGESNKLISESMTKKMVSPYLENGHTGMGVYLQKINGTKYFMHSGSNQGFKAFYYGSMEGGHGLVAMINSDNYELILEIFGSVENVYEWEKEN